MPDFVSCVVDSTFVSTAATAAPATGFVLIGISIRIPMLLFLPRLNEKAGIVSRLAVFSHSLANLFANDHNVACQPSFAARGSAAKPPRGCVARCKQRRNIF